MQSQVPVTEGSVTEGSDKGRHRIQSDIYKKKLPQRMQSQVPATEGQLQKFGYRKRSDTERYF